MPVMVRKQVYIEPRQDRMLKRFAKKRGVTEAEVIRRALEQHMKELERADRGLKAWQESKTFMEEWVKKGPVPGRRTWRREDLYDRFL